MPQLPDNRRRAVSIVVQRSRLAGHNRAHVRFGAADAGYRDLESGAVVCHDESDAALIVRLTNHLVSPELRTSNSLASDAVFAAAPFPLSVDARTPVRLRLPVAS